MPGGNTRAGARLGQALQTGQGSPVGRNTPAGGRPPKGSGCAGDPSQGFVEEFRVKHLVHASGFDRRCGDDLPPQLRALGAGGLPGTPTPAWLRQ